MELSPCFEFWMISKEIDLNRVEDVFNRFSSINVTLKLTVVLSVEHLFHVCIHNLQKGIYLMNT